MQSANASGVDSNEKNNCVAWSPNKMDETPA